MSKEEVEEVPCPACGGKGAFVVVNDLGYVEDWSVCQRCQGTGTILIRIKHQYEDDL